MSALQGCVAAIAGATGSAPYTYDLRGSGVVSNAVETMDSRLALGKVSVRVWDGDEDRAYDELNTLSCEATFSIRVSCLVKDDSSSTIVSQMQDLIADITRRIGQDQTLGGSVTWARIARVEAPSYNAGEQKYGHAVVRVETDRAFDAASEA